MIGVITILSLFLLSVRATSPIPGFRPPAVPLITSDPYFNFWSFGDALTDVNTTLWTGANKTMTGLVRIDGTTYRWMGDTWDAHPINQKSVTVYPCSTVYVFNTSKIEMTVTFTTPMLTSSLELLSRPVTYLNFNVVSVDGNKHSVQLYIDFDANTVVSNPLGERVTWNRQTSSGGLNSMSMGSQAQDYLGNVGDWTAINWGYMYVSAPSSDASQAIQWANITRKDFQNTGLLNTTDLKLGSANASIAPVMAVAWDFSVSSTAVSKTLLLAYDDIYSMYFFGDSMIPYWRMLYDHNPLALLDQAWSDYEDLVAKVQSHDEQLLADMEEIGGSQYATMIALSYRQVVGASKVVWNSKEKEAWYFIKEVSSDGDVSTVDVIFPASPFFLYHNPTLLAMLMVPILEYANNMTWHEYDLLWAPHHLGTWPVANITSGEQENMPVEETANMLLMIAAVVKATGDFSFVYPRHWNLMQQWGEYLVSVLPDPGNQLCTDDFMGPTPHDANLAAKGILGIAAYAMLCKYTGDTLCEAEYGHIASNYAAMWVNLANPNSTNHYVLRYDQPGWSLKYNLLWQPILGLNTFPQSVFDMESDYYLTEMQKYGIPLDVRANLTKIDWQSWTATFDKSPNGFQSRFSPLYKFANETPNRMPLSDFYKVPNAEVIAFYNRPVVGGFWAQD
eukprot:TRINITY_DN529_c0_g1_i2.p1 TRINITY_DN529_c0_g1~~TRINITY_DN529_c0_g1_i2.p1  ORF type:complete len:685 (-),score=223.05 TRINITY_DN529_c0_g1_i2:1467-3491(-)